jgi:hypothetical protein
MMKSRKTVLGMVTVAVVFALMLIFADSATAGWGCRGCGVGYYPTSAHYYQAYRPYGYGYYPASVYSYRAYSPYYAHRPYRYGSWYGYGGYGYGCSYSSYYAPRISCYGCY